MIQQRLAYLRKRMQEENIDVYYIPTNDFHGSEYIGDYFKCREYISGFTGSAGELVVTQKEAGLFTDGRYFLQAEDQLKGTGISLFKLGQEGVPSLSGYLEQILKEGQCLGFDGRLVSGSFVDRLKENMPDVRFQMSLDLVGDIWHDRPALIHHPVTRLDTAYAGEESREKIKKIRKKMQEEKVQYHLITQLDDIAWLLNLRGNDIPCHPVFFGFCMVGIKEIILFVQNDNWEAELVHTLKAEGVTFAPYDSIYAYVKTLPAGINLLLNEETNVAIQMEIPKEVTVIKGKNLTLLPKAVKNPTEVENMKAAHIKDGVAVTKFIYWLKHNVGKQVITELSAAEKLREFRKQQTHFLEESFDPIMAYGEHGAIVHYSPTEKTNCHIKQESFLLSDTGGHYLEGTTDITRTIVLGKLSQQQRTHYTAVLRGNLNLMGAKFLYGCRGVNLDYLARSPLWEMGLDFNHGTGHGVGYLLSVHEPPNSFRWKLGEHAADSAVLEEGMITSDEPGFYLAGEYGIRLENLILCKKAEKNQYGQFMEFEPLTLVPFELEAIDEKQMSIREKQLLNGYHQKVYEAIAPFLDKEEQDWLKEATRAI